MTAHTRRLWVGVISAVIRMLDVSGMAAAAWQPSQPITFVVPAGKGGGADNAPCGWSAWRRSTPTSLGCVRLRKAHGRPDRKGGPKGPRKPLAPPGAPILVGG